MARRSAPRAVVGYVTACVAGYLGRDADDGDDEGGTGADESGAAPPTLESSPALESPTFHDGESIPLRLTGDGYDVSPKLLVADVPDDASSLALLVDDPDAPGGTFTHWLLWDVPTTADAIPVGVPRDESVEALDGGWQGPTTPA